MEDIVETVVRAAGTECSDLDKVHNVASERRKL